jgi:hypothetical protein
MDLNLQRQLGVNPCLSDMLEIINKEYKEKNPELFELSKLDFIFLQASEYIPFNPFNHANKKIVYVYKDAKSYLCKLSNKIIQDVDGTSYYYFIKS